MRAAQVLRVRRVVRDVASSLGYLIAGAGLLALAWAAVAVFFGLCDFAAWVAAIIGG